MVIPLAIIQLVCSASQIRFPASNQQSVFIAALILKDRRCLVNTASKGMKTEPSSETASKILRSVPYAEGFHFFLDTGVYLGESAVSLLTFSLTLEKIELKSIRFHFGRCDFQKWIRTAFGDEELAQRIDCLKPQISDEDLRKQLLEILQKRLVELQTAYK
jgi:hypothetical protein